MATSNSSTTMSSDYIVIGAGSSGSVIARRLLDAGHSVHVVLGAFEQRQHVIP